MSRLRVEVAELPVGWSQISGSGVHLVLGRPSADPLVVQLRATLAADLGAGHTLPENLVDDLLDILLRAGVRGLPDFVAVDEVNPLRLVVRGVPVAEVTVDGEVRTIVSGGARTWADVQVSGIVELVSLRLPVVEQTQEPDPIVITEPVAVSAMRGLPAWPDEAPIPPMPAPRGQQPLAPPPLQELAHPLVPIGKDPHADEHDDLPSYDDLFGSTQRAMAFHAEAEPPTPPPTVEAPPPPPLVVSDLTLPPPAEGSAAAMSEAGANATPVPVPAPAPAPGPPSLIASVPWSKPSAAGSAAPATGPVPRPGSGVHSPPPPVSLRQPTAPPTPPVPAGPVQPSPALVQPVPVVQVGQVMEPARPAYPGVDDHEEIEATVDRSALLAAARSEHVGPTVLAVLCPAGHPSPPHASHCRLCNREIASQQPYNTARPALGILRLSTGDVVSLDRGVLLGRAPKVNGELTGPERPHVLRLASPDNDISRNHAEVLLEGWHVMVRDLGSTNGTTVALPGQEPMRLRPNDQQVIEPGTVVALAEEISFTYEVEA